MLQIPFYDPNQSYEDNYDQGPFGGFVEDKAEDPERTCTERSRSSRRIGGEPQYDFLGQKVSFPKENSPTVYLPFGIPAGPLVNAKFCKAAFEKGFDICVYKTVRTSFFPVHPFPNILAVKLEGDLTIEKAQTKLVADNNYSQPLSITNSFGVPSKEPKVWQEDVKQAITFAGPGQVLVLSFMGTVREGQTEEEFVADYALAAKLSKETGAKILEVNLSCPNIGNEGLVCYNLDMTEKVLAAIRKEIGDTPLIVKVGYYKKDDDLIKLVEIVSKYGQAIAAINTISAEVVDENGNQALPGKNRLRSGVCGAGIKWAGLDMVKRLRKVISGACDQKVLGDSLPVGKAGLQGTVKIIGVGGVMKKEDYFEYINAGADAVMSATGAMWNPNLAQEISKA